MIPFSPPDIYQEIIDEVVDTLKSGWITTGPKTKQFEREISQYTGADATLCLNSATAGLELMLRWYGVGPGDEVIVPVYTYCASANVVLHCGAKVVMVDVKKDFNINVEEIKNKITDKTKVIIPVDFAGFPCDYNELNALVRSPEVVSKFKPSGPNQTKLGRILILSDAAHSFGATYNGLLTGALTDVTVFSFHAVKNLTTAEGGAVCLKLNGFDPAVVYNELCIKSLHGQNKDALAKSQKGNWKYDIVEAGYKWNMTDIQASIGLIGLKNYDSRTMVRRREIFNFYDRAFNEKKWAQMPVHQEFNRTSSYHLYPLRIESITEQQRDEIIKLIFDRDVSVNVHFPILPLLSVYKELGYLSTDYPVALDSFQREISLPVYYNLSDKDLVQVTNAVIQAVELTLSK